MTFSFLHVLLRLGFSIVSIWYHQSHLINSLRTSRHNQPQYSSLNPLAIERSVCYRPVASAKFQLFPWPSIPLSLERQRCFCCKWTLANKNAWKTNMCREIAFLSWPHWRVTTDHSPERYFKRYISSATFLPLNDVICFSNRRREWVHWPLCQHTGRKVFFQMKRVNSGQGVFRWCLSIIFINFCYINQYFQM